MAETAHLPGLQEAGGQPQAPRAQPCPPAPDPQELLEPPGGCAGGAAAPQPERRRAVPDGPAAGAAGRPDALQRHPGLRGSAVWWAAARAGWAGGPQGLIWVPAGTAMGGVLGRGTQTFHCSAHVFK